MRSPFLYAALFMAALSPAMLHGQDQNPDARARQIVAQMTLDEKISQMHGTRTDALFRIVVGVPRLGIPDLLVTNGPAGFGPAGPGHAGKATALPAPIALAATWDVDAARTYGAVAGSEAVDCGNTLLEAPDVNIARVPQCGRTFEAYGEDPFLVARMAVANIEGIQKQGIVANIKHYAANNQEENRGSVSAVIDERTLHEIYLPAFEAGVKEGHVGSLMGAYNRVNGTYCCENAVLLTQILKKEWGFDGFVTSDFGAVHSTVDTATNGLDLEMPTGQYLGELLEAAVKAGKVPIGDIDDHLIRRFRTMMRLGVWDHLPKQKPIPVAINGAIDRRLAEEAMVLLRNEKGTLPLKADGLKSVALIGPYADHAATGGNGSSRVDPLYKVTPLEGLQKRLGPAVAVSMNNGANPASAVELAKAADVAIVMVGHLQSEGADHPLALDPTQDALVEAVAAANPRTIVVVKTGGPLLMPWNEKVPAIVEAWYPGEEDGNAVAAVLFGDVNPSGKLPVTFPKAVADLPAHTPEQYPGVGPKNHTVAQYSEGVFVGYRWYDTQKIEPLYPFGYGLSYTTFDYRNLKLTEDTSKRAAPVLRVDFDIFNTGRMAGAEVAQVYVGIPSVPGAAQPPRQLKGFARVNIAPGQTAHAQVTLDSRAFSYWDTGIHNWKVAPGNYPIYVGSSSRDLRLKGSVALR